MKHRDLETKEEIKKAKNIKLIRWIIISLFIIFGALMIKIKQGG